MRENGREKRKTREAYAIKKIENGVILDSKLLKKQINTLSKLTQVVNDEIGNDLVGAILLMELFEWLPKGEYMIEVKIT